VGGNKAPIDQPHTYFECESYGQAFSESELRECVELTKASLSCALSKNAIDDLRGVLSYLEAFDPKNLSEGRDAAAEKCSFSQTELTNCRRYPASRRVDYLLYRFRFNQYPRKHIVHHFPLVLLVEPTSVCNLRCVMCFQADQALSGNKQLMGFMDYNLYTRLIDEGAQQGLCALVLASRGEPTLHPRFIDMIAYARERGILDIKINTNVTKLTEDYSRRLLAAAPNTIVFSVDSSNKEEFERIRVGAKFEEVVENIKTFNKVRAREFPNLPLRTRISMVVSDHRQNAEMARRFWSTLVDEFAVSRAMNRVDIYHRPLVAETRSCSYLWERMYIWWDGTVNPCDDDYLSNLSAGKLNGCTTVQSVWLGEVMQKLRLRHLQGEKNCLSPCDRCPGF